MGFFIINQYAAGSEYKDRIGERYHFPKKYHSRAPVVPTPFVYYQPRKGGRQVYFGTGVLAPAVLDVDQPDHYYSSISDYQPFPVPVPFHDGPDDCAWENSHRTQNSIRSVDGNLFNMIVAAGGLSASVLSAKPLFLHTQDLEAELQSVTTLLTSKDARVKEIRRICQSYERPSAITNAVKLSRGHICQVCGMPGFQKKDGTYYCEVHHVFHLSKRPPTECLRPKYLIVVCANCHRRLHYADVGEPTPIVNGWRIRIDGTYHEFITVS